MTFLLISSTAQMSTINENKLTELKERWLEIETGFTRNEPVDQFVKYFEKHKSEAIKFKLTKYAKKRGCLKEDYC